MIDDSEFEAAFAAETAQLAAVVSAVEPDLAVPTCPEWTVRDLVTHVGTGHRWSAHIISHQVQSVPSWEKFDAPDDPTQWSDWLISGAGELARLVRDAVPGTTVWTWRPDGTPLFWLRKMLHDEVIHRVDVELADGRLGEVSYDLAVDGVTDLLETATVLSQPVFGHPVFGGLVGSGETLGLRTSHAEWSVRRTPDGVVWQHGGLDTGRNADVVVSAPPRELLLLLNRRLEPTADGVAIAGDRELFTHWLNHTQF